MDIQLSMGTVSYKRKPDSPGIVSAKRDAAAHWGNYNLKTAATQIGKEGHSMIPSHLCGGIKSENFQALQLFALDFDDGTSFDAVRTKCLSYGFRISFAYHTFSSSPEHEKFRIIFVCNCLIEDAYIASLCLHMLCRLFPEADNSCKNLDRIFLGGKELLYLDESALFPLVHLFHTFQDQLNLNKNFKRDISSFSRKTGLLMYHGKPAFGDLEYFVEIDDLGDSAIIHKIEGIPESSIFAIEAKKHVDSSGGSRRLHQGQKCPTQKSSVSIQIPTNCRLLDDFINGTDIHHNLKFLIYTSLKHIKKGKQLFFDTLKEYFPESYEKWCCDARYILEYNPQRCSESCPYYEECESQNTVLDAVTMDRKVYIKEQEYVSMEDASRCLRSNLGKAFRSDKPGFHLISAQTALGKTEAYIDLICQHPNEFFIIAVPTNRLKAEVVGRLEGKIPSEDIFVTRSLDEDSCIIPEEIRDKVKAFHTAGVHNQTKSIVSDYYEEIKHDPDHPVVAEQCQAIIQGIKAVSTQRIIVTTHSYLVFFPEDMIQKYHVIIDEDILQLRFFTNISRVSTDTLNCVIKSHIPIYDECAKQMLESPPDTYCHCTPRDKAFPLSSADFDRIKDNVYGNISDIIYTSTFVKTQTDEKDYITYFHPLYLPKHKYIVMSATLSPHLYELYFEGKAEIFSYPTPPAKYLGKLQQYTYKSLGRKDLFNNLHAFQAAVTIAGNPDIGIVTFKSCKSKPKLAKYNLLDLHFGNSTGIDRYKGNNLCIIGTPFLNPESDKLVAFHLGANANSNADKSPRQRRVNYNGNSFLITTYDDPVLREIHLHSIESELEQCIGRARLLRSDCTVYVFSAFPCSQADIHISNFLGEKERPCAT